MPLKPGDKAPEFTLLDQHEHPVSLADHRGHKVLVYFLPEGGYRRLNGAGVRGA